MDEKKILIYGYGSRTDAVTELARSCGAVPVAAAPEQADETIGFLCGLSGFPAAKHPGPAPEEPQALLLFHGFDSAELDAFLVELRKAGLSDGALKAMVTPTNRSWTLRALSEEVRREHRVMSALVRLQKLREQVPMPDFRNVRLMKALMQAEMLLSGQKDPEPEEVEAAFRELENAM